MKNARGILALALLLASCSGSGGGETDAGHDAGMDAGADLGPAVLPVECLADPACDVTIVCAHRGLCGDEPENTLSAFLNCERQGVPMLEVDTRETADGVVVIMHDTDVVRTTDGETRFPGRTDVDQLTLAEFKSLVIDDERCADDPDADPDRCHPPTFREVLERTGDQTLIDLDFKAGDPAKAGGLIAELGVTGRVLFFDSSIENLRAYRTAAPGGIVMPRAEDADAVATLLGSEYDDLDLKWIHTDPWFVAEVKDVTEAVGVRNYFNGWDGEGSVDVWILAAMLAEESGDQELVDEYNRKASDALAKMIADGGRGLGSDFAQVYVEYLYPDGFGR